MEKVEEVYKINIICMLLNISSYTATMTHFIIAAVDDIIIYAPTGSHAYNVWIYCTNATSI